MIWKWIINKQKQLQIAIQMLLNKAAMCLLPTLISSDIYRFPPTAGNIFLSLMSNKQIDPFKIFKLQFYFIKCNFQIFEYLSLMPNTSGMVIRWILTTYFLSRRCYIPAIYIKTNLKKLFCLWGSEGFVVYDGNR